jgi:beta-glucosidase
MAGFSKGFIWGAASSAYQTEGAWDEDGKGLNIWDEFCRTEGVIQGDETGDIACDGYRRYGEDVGLIKEMNLSAYRFSVNWPRILPEGRGAVNEKGFAYYDALVDLLLKNGITPYLTLHHWELPLALHREGGWQNRDTAKAFGDFAELMARHFQGRVKNYITINEPQCIVSLGYAQGLHAPGLKLPLEGQLACMHNVLLAHGSAMQALRGSADVKAGFATTGRLCYPAEDTPENREAAKAETFRLYEDDWLFTHHWFSDAAVFGRYPNDAPPAMKRFAGSVPDADWGIIKQDMDFIGVNVYNGRAVDSTGIYVPAYPGFPRTAMKWQVTPKVMYYGPLWLYGRYSMPLFITENGQSCNDRIFLDGCVHDPDRIDFLHRYLMELKKAAEEVPVLGYLHWSLTDNFEWHNGYSERFGLIYVDYPTQRRIPKDSARWFAETVKSNGENL